MLAALNRDLILEICDTHIRARNRQRTRRAQQSLRYAQERAQRELEWEAQRTGHPAGTAPPVQQPQEKWYEIMPADDMSLIRNVVRFSGSCRRLKGDIAVLVAALKTEAVGVLCLALHLQSEQELRACAALGADRRRRVLPGTAVVPGLGGLDARLVRILACVLTSTPSANASSLHLDDCGLGWADLVVLAEALRRGAAPSLRSVSLSNVRACDGVVALCYAFKHWPTQLGLRELYLSNSGLDRRRVKALCRLFTSGRVTGLVRLDVQHNALSDRVCAELVGSLSRATSASDAPLELNLDYNGAGKQTLEALAAAFAGGLRLGKLDVVHNGIVTKRGLCSKLQALAASHAFEIPRLTYGGYPRLAAYSMSGEGLGIRWQDPAGEEEEEGEEGRGGELRGPLGF